MIFFLIQCIYAQPVHIYKIFDEFTKNKFFKGYKRAIANCKKLHWALFSEIGPEISVQNRTPDREEYDWAIHDMSANVTILSTRSFQRMSSNVADQALERLNIQEQYNQVIVSFLRLCILLRNALDEKEILINRYESMKSLDQIISGKVKSDSLSEEEIQIVKAKLIASQRALENNKKLIDILVERIYIACEQRVEKDMILNLEMNLKLDECNIHDIVNNSIDVEKMRIEHIQRDVQHKSAILPDISLDLEYRSSRYLPNSSKGKSTGLVLKCNFGAKAIYQAQKANLQRYTASIKYRNKIEDTIIQFERDMNELNKISSEINTLEMHTIPASIKKLKTSIDKTESGQYDPERLIDDHKKLDDAREELINKKNNHASVSLKIIGALSYDCNAENVKKILK